MKINNNKLEQDVMGRSGSFFAEDLKSSKDALCDSIEGARVLVIGAAGSIGGAFVKVVAAYNPSGLWLVDPSENNLVEVVRDLRSSGTKVPKDFGTLAINFGTPEFASFMRKHTKFDYVLNFAALKHVRSERDPYSLMRLIDVNISANQQLLEECIDSGVSKVFAVSSDKAVNPSSLMGASKAFMERVFLSHADKIAFSSARFANVAFSDGSLLHGFLKRIEKRQPLSGPSDIRRFFINHQEAGELCLLSCFTGRNREIYVPRMEPEEYLTCFSEVAERVLSHYGYEVRSCASEEEAIEQAKNMDDDAREWPCYFSPSNTSGEKPFEEFIGENEEVDDTRYSAIRTITKPTEAASNTVKQAHIKFQALRQSGDWTKSELVEIMKSVVPELKHTETNKNLDQKM